MISNLEPVASGERNAFGILKSFGKDFIADMVKLRMMTHKIDYRIEPIPFTPDDLVDPYSSLSLEVRKTGINIL